jgi:outer membrane autotransporter protein
LSRDFAGHNEIVWTPEVRAFYVREMGDDSVRARTSFNGVRSVSFMAESGNWGRNSARLGVGLNAQLSNRLNFRVDYDYEAFDHTATSEFSTTLGVNW